jgi:hypothetical protein
VLSGDRRERDLLADATHPAHDGSRPGGDIYKLSKVLGHSSVAVTEAHYAHLLKEDLVAASQQVKIPIAARQGGASGYRQSAGGPVRTLEEPDIRRCRRNH